MPASQLRLAAAALLAVGVAQAADLVTFLRLIAHHGARAEANPLVRAGATDLGVLPLVIVKVALVVLVVAAVAIVARTRARTSSVVLTLATIAGLMGAFSNVRAL